MTEKQKKVVREVASRIKKSPRSYDQGVWANKCRTAFCIAGHCCNVVGKPCERWGGIVSGNNTKAAADVARRAMGLPQLEADILFSAGWKPRRGMKVWDALRAIARGKSVRDVTRKSVLADFDGSIAVPWG